LAWRNAGKKDENSKEEGAKPSVVKQEKKVRFAGD
jgi:hypothetical protein